MGGVEVHPGGMFQGLTGRTAEAEFFFLRPANDYAQLSKRLQLVL